MSEQVVCHAPGDRCAGCEHYRDPVNHPVCRYAEKHGDQLSDSPEETINDLERRLSDAIRELDELQAKLDSERTTRNYLIKRGGEVERERDDARAALREAIDTHERIAVEYGGTEGIAYKLNMERWRKAAGMEVQ